MISQNLQIQRQIEEERIHQKLYELDLSKKELTSMVNEQQEFFKNLELKKELMLWEQELINQWIQDWRRVI